MIRLYNSLTNKIEEFVPIKENEVSMYVCGATVYDNMHIGNSRPVIFFDCVKRFFTYLGYKVTYASNFTDIDDKIIKKANLENTTEQKIAEKYIKEILCTNACLTCLPYDHNPRVTQKIPQIIEFIKKLVEVNAAYVIDNDVYFDVSSVKEYGILSNQDIDSLILGERLEINDKKRNPIDFVLWKETKEGLNWDSPWGKGRPGWHTECVVMVDDIFKGKIDIHGGGSDLKFPHHENEIAQSLSANNHMIANYWMHNGRIDFGKEKMSKSLGNVIWANDLLEKIGCGAYRLLILNTPYRQTLTYKDELLNQYTNDYEKIKRAYTSLYRTVEIVSAIEDVEIKDVELNNLKTEFIEAMSNDFNTANAITTIFKLVKLTNNILRGKNDVKYLKEVLTLFKELLWVLGISVDLSSLSEEEKNLYKLWEEARTNKDFTKADEYRERLVKLGILT